MEGRPEIRFAPARGGRIAYQVWGEGPDVVAIPPMAQNIDSAWEWPELAAMFERFGSFCRFLHFDKRGTGSSDRSVLVPDVDARVDDLRALMDAEDVERAHLYAQSEGGPMTLLFAATYPERVESVILVGSGARMFPDGLDDDAMEQVRERQTAFADAWGTAESWTIEHFAPSMVDDREFRAWWPRYERSAASRDSLLDLFEQIRHLDARAVVPDLDVPILVVHRRGDRAVPVEFGREVVELARDATLIELDGEDHYSFVGDLDEWMVPMERWVTGTVADRPVAPREDRSVRIETLGRFAVTVGGDEVETSDWGSRLARTLLKRLVVARGWPVTRDELFELLWPDESDRTKLGPRLSVQLSAVRRVLGGGVIADRQTVALDLDHVGTDLTDWFELTDDADVVDRYAGDLFPEERYDDWSGPFRDEARTRFVLAARRELARAEGQRDDQRSAELARQLIEADEWDTDAHRSLVAALERAGDRAGAERARAAAAAVADDLGLDPDSGP